MPNPHKTKPQHLADFNITLVATVSGNEVTLASTYTNPNNYLIRNHAVIRRAHGAAPDVTWESINVGEQWVANGPCGGPLSGYTWVDKTRQPGIVYDYYATVTYVIVPCNEFYQGEQHSSAVSETIVL